jgi:tRNA(Ile)-lysidine synthase
VALSGGGDSLALLLIAKAWADRRGREILALTLDHGLRPEAAEWARWCERRCRRLGVAHRTLAWTGEKPPTGLSAAARTARHVLLAQAAREAGARVILMGHTADDRAEAALMRQAGASTPSPRTWSPSPAWPEGRGVFLLRPMLAVRRGELRMWLRAAGETWIEDPANNDPSSARTQARLALSDRDRHDPPDDPEADEYAGLEAAEAGLAGDFHLTRERLIGSADAPKLLGAALLCAAGTTRPPRRDALARLLARVAAGEHFAATLAGAKILAGPDSVCVVRDIADRRGGGADIALIPGRTAVWDGRFALRTGLEGICVRPLAGRAASLDANQRRALAAIPAAARPALPLALLPDGRRACPILTASADVEARSLGFERFAAARGAFVNEATLGRMAESAVPP